MKRKQLLALLAAFGLVAALCACGAQETQTSQATESSTLTAQDSQTEATDILLSDAGVTCASDAVYTANDIIYYEAGHDATYGAGEEADAHTAEEAAVHTVVHITRAGTYRLTGTLSAGQIFVDLGEDAKDDENARVTLILDGVDITCTVAPAVLFYRVYECGDDENFTLTPDLSMAGAVVELAEGSENVINGSYVAKIYKEGTEKKLHKYDGAFYSKSSMRIGGEGALTITAENEGLDSELHLQIDGGAITIGAQNDGINTNEDGISVTTINGGALYINAGLGAEGDGIDSNGALVVNGGTIYVMANPRTGDGGLDADLDICINGGQVIASGSRNDDISNECQPALALTFAQTIEEGSVLRLTDEAGETLLTFTAARAYSALVLSTPELARDTVYHLWIDDTLYQHGGMSSFGNFGGARPDGMEEPPAGMEQPGERPDGMEEPPAGMEQPGERPDGMEEPPAGMEQPGERPDGMEEPPAGMEQPGERSDGMEEPPTGLGGAMPGSGFDEAISTEATTDFVITANLNGFYNVAPAQDAAK